MKKNGAGQKRTGSATLAAGPITSGIGFYLKQSQYRRRRSNFKQCCGAGGAEIILEPGAGAENKFL